MRTLLFLATGLVLAVVGPGCGKKGPVGDPQEPIPIPKGKRPKGTYLLVRVKLDGKVLPAMQVTLEQAQKEVIRKQGTTDKNGVALVEDLKPGKYMVGVDLPDISDKTPPKPDEQLKGEIRAPPRRYMFPGNSGLEVNIVTGENQVEFNLKS